MPDVIDDLQKVAASNKLDLNSIVEGARNSLKLIEPWREASVDNEQLMSFVQEIQKNGLIYYDAIDKSIKTAEDGHALSSDVIDLCDYLLDPNIELKDIQEYVETMQTKATLARKDSTETKEMFRIVRTGLFKVSQQIPKEVEKLGKAGDASKNGITFKLNPFGKKSESSAELRKRELKCEVVIAELNRATSDLNELLKGVDKFISWWVVTETILKTQEGRGESLNPKKVQRLVVKAMQKDWRKIQADYLEYKIKIVQLQDYYPTPTQRHGVHPG